MNNKLLSYEDAVEELKVLEQYQRNNKGWRGIQARCCQKNGNVHQTAIAVRKKEINLLLSIIAAHKSARKLYGKVAKLEHNIGLIDGIYV